MERHRKRQYTFSSAYLLIALGLLVILQIFAAREPEPEEIAYSRLVELVQAGEVTELEIGEEELTAVLRVPDTVAAAAQEGEAPAAPRVVATRLPEVDETGLVEMLEANGVEYTGRIEAESVWGQLLIGWLPILLLVALWWFGIRHVSKRGGPLNVGKSQAKIYDRNAKERVTFEEVAGVEEAKAELIEVVSFLKDPTKYRRLGARIPKGVLLVGPPGTGKTLLARAVAGEADVPFFSLSGSEFVEMFVGVGAARMRALFEQAKERAPCIIFIDELDAIGKSRGGVTAMATHDEREQTLNQLLVEMDGFDPGKGVILMAATNRPEVLDRALLRPGRFDRQVLVDRPTVDGREAILRVHARRIRLAEDVRLKVIAQRTVGMVGADLANVVNEAALAAGRRGADAVAMRDFEEAIDRIQLGLQRRGRVMGEREKRRVAIHEAGHALVALSVEHADPVHRVTIIPRSIGALGATLQLPTEDRYLVTRPELLDRLCVMLGGRAAEEIELEDVSTGAHNDLERATETARQMVTRFGMSRLGPVTFGRPAGSQFLQMPFTPGEERNFSEETARAIDAEVNGIIAGAHRRAQQILRDRRDDLRRIAELLLERETLEQHELAAIVDQPVDVSRRDGLEPVTGAVRRAGERRWQAPRASSAEGRQPDGGSGNGDGGGRDDWREQR